MQNFIKFVSKAFKIFCFGFVPLMLLAGGSKRNFENSKLDRGTCSFDIEGQSSFHLDGSATFQSKSEVDRFGNKTDKLVLSFITCGERQNQNLEFVIASKTYRNSGVQPGRYEIKSINRLMNNFSGVYGFADMGNISELPFFIKSGSLIITENISNKVDGKLEIRLVNTEGEFLKIKGSFNADIKA
ncbi:MAG: hypothetical protein ABJI22_01335 [Maribacter sp.]